MYCGRCGNAANEAALFCEACGNKLVAETSDNNGSKENRPIAGIVVAGLVGIVGVLWGFTEFFMILYSEPTEFDKAFDEAFPEVALMSMLWTSLGLIGNSAITVGAILSFLHHQSGNKVVRLSSWFMLIGTAISLLISYSSITSAEAWQTLDVPMKSGLIGGMVGGFLGSAVIFGLIIFLFRKSRWP